MSLEYILDRVGKKLGINPNDSHQRSIMLDYVNEAAQELYEESDMVGSLTEDSFYVQGDKTIALPSNVSSVRAIREKESQTTWNLSNLTERYAFNNLEQDDRTWRIKGYETFMVTPTSYSGMKATATQAMTDITLTVVGSRSGATRFVEEVEMDATSNTFSTTFTSIESIIKSDVCTYDISIKQSDDTVVAVIPNNEKESRYLIVDVSEYPWESDAAQNDEHTLEVLYKKKLPYLSKDSDEFPADGYDNIIINKVMQLFLEEQGKMEEAILYDRKATRSLGRRNADLERGQLQKVRFDKHPHDKLNISLINKYTRASRTIGPY
ncbi:MAG: hypothetical protein CMM02_08595 [Rhodopirellula sp.]|nr:hypothetical protein [Rhodopirellula sp.]